MTLKKINGFDHVIVLSIGLRSSACQRGFQLKLITTYTLPKTKQWHSKTNHLSQWVNNILNEKSWIIKKFCLTLG